MKKVFSGFLLAGLGVMAQQAYATATSQGVVEGHVTSVTVTDRSIENSTLADSDLQLTFDVAGAECTGSGSARAAGATYVIHRSDQTSGVFDNFVKTAQAAYLSGKVLRYSTAKSSNASNPNLCYAYYMQLK